MLHPAAWLKEALIVQEGLVGDVRGLSLIPTDEQACIAFVAVGDGTELRPYELVTVRCSPAAGVAVTSLDGEWCGVEIDLTEHVRWQTKSSLLSDGESTVGGQVTQMMYNEKYYRNRGYSLSSYLVTYRHQLSYNHTFRGAHASISHFVTTTPAIFNVSVTPPFIYRTDSKGSSTRIKLQEDFVAQIERNKNKQDFEIMQRRV